MQHTAYDAVVLDKTRLRECSPRILIPLSAKVRVRIPARVFVVGHRKTGSV
jgi:hypothetical protein